MSSPKCRAGDEEAPMRGYASKQGPMLLLESAIDGLTDEFTCTFQPYSLTVLRVGCSRTGR